MGLRKLLGTATQTGLTAVGGAFGGPAGAAAGAAVGGIANKKISGSPKTGLGQGGGSVSPITRPIDVASTIPPMSASSLGEARMQDKTRMKAKYGIY